MGMVACLNSHLRMLRAKFWVLNVESAFQNFNHAHNAVSLQPKKPSGLSAEC
jgi:hypothetical protein